MEYDEIVELEMLEQSVSNENHFNINPVSGCMEYKDTTLDDDDQENKNTNYKPITKKPIDSALLVKTCEESTTVSPSAHGSSLSTINLENVLNKLASTMTSVSEKDEFESFGNTIALQLRQIPLRNAVKLMLKIQEQVTEERLRCMNK